MCAPHLVLVKCTERIRFANLVFGYEWPRQDRVEDEYTLGVHLSEFSTCRKWVVRKGRGVIA